MYVHECLMSAWFGLSKVSISYESVHKFVTDNYNGKTIYDSGLIITTLTIIRSGQFNKLYMGHCDREKKIQLNKNLKN